MPSGQSSSVHTESHAPFPVFLIIRHFCLGSKTMLLPRRSQCCDPDAREKSEKISVMFALWENPDTGDTFTPTAPSLSVVPVKRWGGWGDGEANELKQRSALFEIILSCTSYFSLLLWETQTDTFIQQWSCADMVPSREFSSGYSGKYNKFIV